MADITDIILALIAKTQWFVIAFIVEQVFGSKPKRVSISFLDHLHITSER